jgi:c-di-GMP-binding flagellar brake protein YcgR
MTSSERDDPDFPPSEAPADAARVVDDIAVTERGATAPGDYPFEAMQLKVGNRLQVQPPPRISMDRSFVRLIGYLQNHSLLITAPKNALGATLPLAEGDTLVLRAFSGQNAFAFACDVQRVCRMPYNYLHLAFPASVQGTMIRKAPRVRTKIGVSVRNGRTQNRELIGVISNLSANGALLDGPRDMAQDGDRLSLGFRLKLHGIDNSLNVQAVVRAVLTDEKLEQSGTSLVHFGLEFVDLAPQDQMVLKSMVYQKMIEDPQSVT